MHEIRQSIRDQVLLSENNFNFSLI